jgi:2-hydroxy-6-oxonona-2,4-dienedioate hydrolase
MTQLKGAGSIAPGARLNRGRVDRGHRERTPVAALGVTVHARAWGEPDGRPPLVLVAGLGVSSRYWVRLGRRLAAAGWAVLAPDLPGFGRTAPPPDVPWPAGPSPSEQADQLLAWMDARGLGRVVLVGHSVGCQTVVDLATRFPARVARLIIAAPPFEPGRRSLPVSLVRLAAAALFEVPSLPPLLVAEYATAGAPRAIQQALRSMDYPIERALPRVAVPTLVIHGRLDPLVSRGWAGAVTQLLPGAALVEVERAGHAIHYSAAAVTAGVIDRFLRGQLDGPPTIDGDVVVAADDPRHDPLGPPQPIPAVAPAAVPMVVVASVAAAAGVGMLVAGIARRRRSMAAVALSVLAVAILTAKPTGPARRYAV